MASEIIYGSTANAYIESKIEWSSTANTTANTSAVTASLYYRRTNTGYKTYGTGTFSVTIDGTKTSVTKELSIESAWVKAITATKTVAHSDSGSKSISISASGSISGTTLASTSCSGTAKLDTIPRASTLTSASNVTLGNKCGVKWTPMASSFRYKLKFSLGSWSYTTGAIHPNTTSAYNYTGYTIPLDVAKQITSANTGTMTATLYTYSDSGATTQVGSASAKTFTVTVPSNESTRPTVTMSLSPVSSLGATFSGLYIQGMTKVIASFTGSSAKYGASISSYSMSVSGLGIYGSPYQSGWLSKSGTISVTGTAKDSRGFSASISKSISVISYSKPSVIPYTGEKSIICKRCDKDGNLTSSGTCLRIKVGRKYSKVITSGVQKNFCVIRYRCKPTVGLSFSDSDWVTLLARNKTDVDEVDVVIENAVPSIVTSYTVQIGVDDDISQTPSPIEINVPTNEVTFHLKKGGKGVGIGKYAETDNSLEIADDWDVKGRVYGLGKGKADIQEGADLNNYKEFGVYNIASNTVAETLLNCPSAQAGTLIVSSANGSGKNSGEWIYILQKYTTIDGKYEFYRLVYTSATAEEWLYNKWEARSNKFWEGLGLSDSVSASEINNGRYKSDDCYYRVVDENHVYVAFNCAFTYNNQTIMVSKNPIPKKYRPTRSVYAICATGGRAVARVFVTSSGNVGIDWIQLLPSAEATASSTVYWIDGYIDYWI